jgi:hypothetical protein
MAFVLGGEVMNRSLLLFLLLVVGVLLAGCSPCRVFSQKAEMCDDLVEGVSVDLAVASCNQIEPGATGLTQVEFDCLLNCGGTSATCTQYFERTYFTCECENRCDVPCNSNSGDDDDSAPF